MSGKYALANKTACYHCGLNLDTPNAPGCCLLYSHQVNALLFCVLEMFRKKKIVHLFIILSYIFTSVRNAFSVEN